MKTLKIFNYFLLVIAFFLAVTTVFAFVNGNTIYGIHNILWMGCEVVFFWANKIHIEIEQDKADIYVFLSAMNDTIEKYGAAIITENEDGKWEITAGIAVERNNPSCSAENNDQIAYGHISDNDENK